LAAVWLLSLKTLLFDVFGHHGAAVSDPAPGQSG
jgi:hypothetical protein